VAWIWEGSAKGNLSSLLLNLEDKSSFDAPGAVVGCIEVDDPVHGIRPAVAATAMGIQRYLLQAAYAQPKLPDWLTRLRAAEREAEHEAEDKQRLGQ
jgi:hypothetical protein